MTHEVAPAVLVSHEVGAEREAIQGNAAMNSIIGPILYEGVRVRGEHAWCEVNQHLMTVISCLPRGNGTILHRESAHEETHQSLYAATPSRIGLCISASVSVADS